MKHARPLRLTALALLLVLLCGCGEGTPVAFPAQEYHGNGDSSAAQRTEGGGADLPDREEPAGTGSARLGALPALHYSVHQPPQGLLEAMEALEEQRFWDAVESGRFALFGEWSVYFATADYAVPQSGTPVLPARIVCTNPAGDILPLLDTSRPIRAMYWTGRQTLAVEIIVGIQGYDAAFDYWELDLAAGTLEPMALDYRFPESHASAALGRESPSTLTGYNLWHRGKRYCVALPLQGMGYHLFGEAPDGSLTLLAEGYGRAIFSRGCVYTKASGEAELYERNLSTGDSRVVHSFSNPNDLFYSVGYGVLLLETQGRAINLLTGQEAVQEWEILRAGCADETGIYYSGPELGIRHAPTGGEERVLDESLAPYILWRDGDRLVWMDYAENGEDCVWGAIPLN